MKRKRKFVTAIRALLILATLAAPFGFPNSAEAGKRHCREHPEDSRCATPTATSPVLETDEPPSKESTATDVPSATQTPSETPVAPASTEESTATPTATGTPGQDPASPTPTSTPTTMPVPTETPEINASCQIHEEYVSWDWTAFYVTHSGGYNETVIWSFTVTGTDWVGMWMGVDGDTRDGWGSDNANRGAFGTLLPAGEFTVNIMVDGVAGVVCSKTITVPNQPPPPTETPVPPPEEEKEDIQESSQPESPVVQNLGTTSPNGWYQLISQGGQVLVRDGYGREIGIGEGADATYLADWTILIAREDGSLFLTDRLATFTREIGVSGKVLGISTDGEWVKVSNDGHPTVVSIHGARYGLGSADAQAFANIVFPDHASGP